MGALIETGKLINTHGIRGELKAEVWADSPEAAAKVKKLYFDENTGYDVTRAFVHKGFVIYKLSGIDTIEAAQPLLNKRIYIDKTERKLPRGTYYVQDLIGLEVRDAESGTVYGKIYEVRNTGANDIYYVRDDTGKEVLIPVIGGVVNEVSVDGGYMTVTLPDGLLDL